MKLEITVHVLGQADPSSIKVRGRNAWALRELHRAGNAGYTPIDNPAPRWSGYVHKLRHIHGLEIETAHETRRGAFPGNHARYVLRSKVEVIDDPASVTGSTG